MAGDDVTRQDLVSETDEPEDDEDVAGHGIQSTGMTPDPEVRRPRAIEDGKSDPAEH